MLAVIRQRWNRRGCGIKPSLKPLRDNPPTHEQKKALSELAEKMKLTPMEQPWAYIKKLQASFDYSKIKYTEDYYDVDMNPEAEPTIPEWKVYFDGDFWGHSGKDRSGTEIRLNKQFDWRGIIGLFLRRILAARDSSWTLYAYPGRRHSQVHN